MTPRIETTKVICAPEILVLLLLKTSAQLFILSKKTYRFSIRICLVIKDWSVSAPNSHITGGMTYKDGQLTVPITGRYYIYAQFYYHHSGRIYLRINNNIITMIQPPTPDRSRQHGTLYAGGVFQLKAGDVITALATNVGGTVKGHIASRHSYLGAFLI